MFIPGALIICTSITTSFYKSAGEDKSNLDLLRSLAIDNWPEEDLCSEAERGRAVSDLDFFTLLPPLAGCLPFKDDTDTTTSVDTPSCSADKNMGLASESRVVENLVLEETLI